MTYEETRQAVTTLLTPYSHAIMWRVDGPEDTAVKCMEAATLYTPEEMEEKSGEMIGVIIIQYFKEGGCAFYYDENCINPMLGLPLDNRFETSDALIRGMATQMPVALL